MPTQTVAVKTDQSGFGSIQFDFGGLHNVKQLMNKESFDNCNFDSATLLSSDPGYIFKGTAGTYYFACSIYDHCQNGQKLQLEITGDTTNAGFFNYNQTRKRNHREY